MGKGVVVEIPAQIAQDRCGIFGEEWRRYRELKEIRALRTGKHDGRSVGFYDESEIPTQHLSQSAIDVIQYISQDRYYYTIQDGAHGVNETTFEVNVGFIADAMEIYASVAKDALDELVAAGWMTKSKDRRGKPSYRITKTTLTYCPHTRNEV